MVVSVTERSERDLTKRFDETEIDWPVVEKQLVAWGLLFHADKKLRVDLSFNYLKHVSHRPQSAEKPASSQASPRTTHASIGPSIYCATIKYHYPCAHLV